MNRLSSVILACFAVLCAGQGSDAASSLPGPDDLVLSVSEGCPGQVTISWEGAAPDHWAALAFSHSTGSFILPNGPCGGTEIGLYYGGGFRATPPFRTGPQGQGEFRPRMASGACGGFLQMIVYDNPCTTSNVAQIP